MVCYLKHKAGTSLPFLVVGVAQLVRAPGCGPGGRGFESLHSPQFAPRCRQAHGAERSLSSPLAHASVNRKLISLFSFQSQLHPSATLPEFSLHAMRSALCSMPLLTQRRYPEIIRRHEKALIGL